MSWTSLEPRSDCLFLGLVNENEKQGYGGLMELQRKSFCVLSIEWLNLIYQRQEEVVAITTVRQLAQTLSAYPSCYCPPLWRHTDKAIKILVLNFFHLFSTCHWLLISLTLRLLVPYLSHWVLPTVWIFFLLSLVKVCSPHSSVPWCFWARESFCHLYWSPIARYFLAPFSWSREEGLCMNVRKSRGLCRNLHGVLIHQGRNACWILSEQWTY